LSASGNEAIRATESADFMLGSESQRETYGAARAQFTATHWTVVLAARGAESSAQAQALEELCRTYWYPLYAYARRRGCKPEEAQDLTQEFFARLLEKQFLSAVDPAKGKFRSFLLAALEHLLAKEWRRENALKRGGGKIVLSLDAQEAETRYLLEPKDEMTPERIFERRWAITLLERTMARLRTECSAEGKGRLFELLKGALAGEKCASGYGAVAVELGMTEAAVKMAAHRLRQRYGELLREEIAPTVGTPEEVDEEIHYLFRAVAL
jgi:DNA-directed RNA polymerase specialized sigma24 family protein